MENARGYACAPELDLPRRMNSQCFQKCIVRFGDNNLSKAEIECTDACIEKYMDATNKVGEVIAVQTQQAQAQ